MAEAIETHTTEQQRDRHSLISKLEGALAVSHGISEAISELASTKSNPERRLSGICSITLGLIDQLNDARQAVRELYDLYYADKEVGQ